MKFLITLIIFTFQSFADSPTYLFLRNDVSARAAAMGGSFVSMKNDPNGIFYNPALLSTINQEKFSLGYMTFLSQYKTTYFSYSTVFDSTSKLGVGLIYNSYGDFIEKDEYNNELGTFSVSDLVLITSYAFNYDENISIGVSSKLIYSAISNYSSNALALDAGIYYFIPGNNPLSIGASIQHLGKQINSYNTTEEDLPLDVKIGITLKPEHLPLDINLNFHKINVQQNIISDRLRYFTIGGEFTISESMRLRFGYNNEKRKDMKLGTSSDMAGFSFGGGIVKENYTIDYSYSSLGKIGEVSRINVGYSF